MTQQEAFNKAVKHLRTQNQQCLRKENPTACLYRGPQGMKCAIGALFPDSEYKSKFDNENGITDIRTIARQIPALNGLALYFLYDLQVLHDCNTPDMWEQKFIEFAADWKLTVPPVTKRKS